MKGPSPESSLARVRAHGDILVDFARVAGESTDLQRLLDLACHHAARAVGVAHSKVMQVRHDKGDLFLVSGRGWAPGVVGHSSFGIDMLSPPGRAYQMRDMVRIGNLPKDPNFRLSAVLRDHGIHSVLNAPIAIDGVVWGVLEVDATEQDRFDADDERFVQGFALVLALAIQHRQAQQQRERHAENLGRKIMQADTLLKEQNHRVRNYFQLILTILSNRSRNASDESMRGEYDSIMERVTAIALAHDQLAFDDRGQTHVNAANYIDALCSGVERAVERSFKVERDVEAIELRADRAVPLGLVLNELLTNAIKYAVKGRDQALVKVRLASHNAPSEAVLEVIDDGPGIGDARTGSMGLKLVERLATQLSGQLNVESSSQGTTVTLRFPLVE